MSRREMCRCLLPSELPFWGTAGALIDGEVPSGRKRLRVEEILYQPEAARTTELDANCVDHISYYPAA